MGDAEPPTLSSSTEPRAWTSMGKRHRHISQRLNRHLSIYPFELYQWMRAIDHYRRNTATESTRPPPPVPDKVLLNLRNRLQQRRKKGQVHIIVDNGKYFIKGTYYTGVYHVSQSLCQSLRTIPSIHFFFALSPPVIFVTSMSATTTATLGVSMRGVALEIRLAASIRCMMQATSTIVGSAPATLALPANPPPLALPRYRPCQHAEDEKERTPYTLKTCRCDFPRSQHH
jgi:hypothetical protein